MWLLKDLQNQFEKVQLGLDVFRERLQETNGKVGNLVEDVASKSLDVYTQEKIVLAAHQEMGDLRSELEETKERLRLVQRIIQEKDDHIQTLEEEVSDIQSVVGSKDVNAEEISKLRGRDGCHGR